MSATNVARAGKRGNILLVWPITAVVADGQTGHSV